MGSTKKSSASGKKSLKENKSTPAKSKKDESNNNEKSVEKPPEGKLLERKNILEAIDSPVPFVVPPGENRILKVRNCGTTEFKVKISVQNADATDVDKKFKITPVQAVIAPNDILPITISYTVINTESVKSKQKNKSTRQSKTENKSKSENAEEVSEPQEKRHALLEVIIGDKEYFYMYPLLGSSDPIDEQNASKKQVNSNKSIYVESEKRTSEDDEDEDDEEGSESEVDVIATESTKKKRPLKLKNTENRTSKRRKVNTEIDTSIKENTPKQQPTKVPALKEVRVNLSKTPKRIINLYKNGGQDSSITEQVQIKEEIEIKDEPIDLP